LKSRKSLRRICVETLRNFASDSPEAVKQIIDQDGLKWIFSLFITCSESPKKPKKGELFIKTSAEEVLKTEENILSLLNSLIRHSREVQRDRVLYKFSEKNYEKLRRLEVLREKHSVMQLN